MKTISIGIVIAVAGMLASPVFASEAVPYKAVTIPDNWKFPEPDARGKPYPVPATNWEKRPVLWGWTCELPGGSGLSFGGVHQTADDGNPHTSIMEGGAWKPIIEDLRKNNPLQKQAAAVQALRKAVKDTLAKARNLYFEGKTADEEAGVLKSEIDPALAKISADLTKLNSELSALSGMGEYETGQLKFVGKRLESAAAGIKPFGAKTTPEQMATLRRAQIELEIAAEGFEAEPAPRALSRITYDPKTKLFVIFGGGHMDYETNDLWVFDSAKRRWFQRHPAMSPEPRGDHRLEPLGDGRIVMRGGYVYEPGKGYLHAGPDRWIYDIEKNVWSADGHQLKLVDSDSRSARYFPPATPESFMKGNRPDAAANEAVLKALPVNTWVKLKTPIPLGGRDWGTWGFDFDRDLLYVFAGGHASYPGNDVARYHIKTDRFEISDPIELPLGCQGTNEQYPCGFNFNLRPWCRPHVWNGQCYDPQLKQFILGSSTIPALDPYTYHYDPDVADWVSRQHLPAGMGNGAYSCQLRYTKHGMLSWYGTDVWMLDEKAREWKKVTVKGTMPATGVDSCGMVYDSKRDRMIFITLGGYARPFDGQLHALDLTTFQLTQLNPEGMGSVKAWDFFCREVAYQPESDTFLWPCRVKSGQARSADQFPCYDAAKNRWVTVKLPMPKDSQFDNSLVCVSLGYDAKRGLFWLGDSSWCGGVVALRFDFAKAEIAPLKDYVSPPAPEKK